jgi:tetratricopeptide (TPR) repeat protein
LNASDELRVYAIEGDSLGRQLDLIGRAQASGLSEAVVFYTGRILEYLSGHALTLVRQRPQPNAFANLSALEQASLIHGPVLELANTLRRLANRARHSAAPVTAADADLAIWCLAETLLWFFGDFVRGPRMALTLEQIGLPVDGSRDSAELIEVITQVLDGKTERAGDVVRATSRLTSAPSLAAIAAQSLISSNLLNEARSLLQEARSKWPTDRRLAQMDGLAYRRERAIDRAIAIFEALYKQDPEDEETIGIFAACLKQRWEMDSTSSDNLEKSARLYRDGWLRSHSENLYLGVNAAATLTWLGRDEGREIASVLRDKLALRRAHFESVGITGDSWRSYYDLATEAEALLLAGDEDQSRKKFATAFAQFAELRGDIAGTTAQVNRTLARQGRPPLTNP